MNRRQEKSRIDLIIGKNICKAREARRLTRDELAELMGITPSHVRLIELGERGATAVNLSKFSRALDVSVEMFLVDHNEKDLPCFEGQDLDATAGRLKITNAIGSLTARDLELVICLIEGINSL